MYEKWRNLGRVILGASIAGAALELFLVPLHIAAGGVGGLAIILNDLTGINVGILILLINIPIFALGMVCFRKEFLFTSLWGTLALSISSQILSSFPPVTNDPLLATVFGGAGTGLGLGLVLSVNGTTGGTDIVALVLQKKFPAVSLGQFFLYIDGAVILTAGLVFRQWEVILYSSLTLFVSSKILDAVLAGIDFAMMVYIVSDHAEDISQIIFREMQRGVTGLESVSLYSGKSRKVLLCVIRKMELPKLKQVISIIDQNAFLVISDAREVLGKGFKMTM